jgi:hypothetical protein
MAGFTRVNGTGSTHGTAYSVYQMKAFEVDALVSLAAKGGIGSTIERIVQEFQPLMYISSGTAGKMQIRLRALGTVDSIDLSSATVTERNLATFDFT